MLNQLVGSFFIWLAAFFSQVENLAANESIRILHRDIPKKLIAMVLISIASGGLCWQVYQAWKTNVQVTTLKREVSVANSRLFNEASGGTVIKDLAYVVDDEKPAVFEFRFTKDSYERIDKIQLKEKGAVLTGDDVDDLEAAASSIDGKLYLITSHSNSTKKGKPSPARQRLLEVSLDPGMRGEITNSANSLREFILKKLTGDHVAEPYTNNQNLLEVMDIEGLAIDKQGNAYLGLRTPLTTEGKYALVLRAKLSDLFSKDKEVPFEVFRLDLWHRNDDDNQSSVPYGIVSLDYDARTGRMLIIGNSSVNSEHFSPILCQWDFAGEHRDDPIQPTQCSPIPAYQANGSTSKTSKIELLLLPPESNSDRVFMFLDTGDTGNGGQLSYTRSELGLVK